jgi:eukaryotic-like serine/threonine-protein kinase
MAEHVVGHADAAERYRLDLRIASGGMGEVWRATDTLLDRVVAVKLLKQEHADDAVFRSRFEIEARHAAALRHPGVAQVFDFGSGDLTHAPYLVMEYVEGEPLSALLRAGDPMDPAAATDLLAGAGDAIGAAHAQGIVHRDVKPGNLMVTPDRRVKITDFGIARAADGLALTRTGEVMGTPQYLSPEQAEGKPATPASDVYSLGAVGYECLVGRRPYVADSAVATALAHLREPVPELPDSVPAGLAAVVRRAMAKDPAERYPDGSAFAAAIRAAATTDTAEPPVTKVFTTPVPLATPPAAAAVSSGAGLDTWRDRAGRVPAPLWAVAGVFVLVVVVASIAGLTGGGGSTPSHRGPAHTPGAASTRTGPSSPLTTSTSVQTPPTHSPKPPKDHGPTHGHKGKGHDK